MADILHDLVTGIHWILILFPLHSRADLGGPSLYIATEARYVYLLTVSLKLRSISQRASLLENTVFGQTG